MKAIKDAGFPDGVINMVPCSGSEFGENVLKHPELTAVNFTGSYDTAWRINGILNGSGPRPHFPRLIAETGGKDFMWVDESAVPWIDDIATQMIAGAYGRTGQKCSANSRAYVPDRMLDDLLDRIVVQLGHFSTGDPTNDKVNMGPVINEAGNFYINRKTTGALVAQQPFGGDGASGTNRKAGSKDYLKEFISRAVVGYRHSTAPGRD